jgi:hypothetical protein
MQPTRAAGFTGLSFRRCAPTFNARLAAWICSTCLAGCGGPDRDFGVSTDPSAKPVEAGLTPSGSTPSSSNGAAHVDSGMLTPQDAGDASTGASTTPATSRDADAPTAVSDAGSERDSGEMSTVPTEGGLGPDESDASSAADAGVSACPSSGGWEPLVTAAWELSAFEEGYRCHRAAIAEDQWLAGFCVDAPAAAQNLTLTVGDDGLPVGDYTCGAETLDDEMLYSGGPGTQALELPSGIAMKLAAGRYVNVNLHLLSTTDAQLSDAATVYVKRTPQADVEHEADMVFAGTLSLSIPSNNQLYTVNGGCTIPQDWHVFALWPHMNRLATRQAVNVKTSASAATTTLLDEAFGYDEQRAYPIPEALLSAGGQIETSCSYVNDTGSTVTFGDSIYSERCLVGVYKWPAGGAPFDCTN